MTDVDSMQEENELLLSNESTIGQSKKQLLPEWKPNPLPWAQLANALLVEFCAAIEQQSVLPYITQLVSRLDVVKGDKRKIGYYVGLLGSLRSVANTLTILPLSRLSDHIGRKPVMLSGMVASTVYMLCFGLSRTFLGLVMSVCIGALNCNPGVVKIVVGGITDSTNRARGFAWILMLWSIGGSFSSLLGGGLSQPSIRFPHFFGGEFWKQNPYFLPCLAVAIITTLSIFVVLFTFEETLPNRSSLSQDLGNLPSSLSNRDGPSSMWRIITYPIIIVVANFAMFDALFACHEILLPLFLAMPIELGGLDFDPVTIGYILGSFRAFTAFFLTICCPRIIHHLGERRAFNLALYSAMFAWIIMPMANILARHSGITMAVWACIAFLALPGALMMMGSACSYIYVTAAAPSHDTLGAVNGLSRTIASIGSALTPLMATSLFSLTAEYKILGGYATYVVLLSLSCFAVWLARRLPRDTRPVWEVEGGANSEGNVTI